MNPDVNIPAYDIESDKIKRPWMHERVFGGRGYKQKCGFFYWYDVVICMTGDAIVDCIGDITIRASKTLGQICYSEMRRRLWSEEPKFMYYINQTSIRLFGCVVISKLIAFVWRLIESIV